MKMRGIARKSQFSFLKLLSQLLVAFASSAVFASPAYAQGYCICSASWGDEIHPEGGIGLVYFTHGAVSYPFIVEEESVCNIFANPSESAASQAFYSYLKSQGIRPKGASCSYHSNEQDADSWFDYLMEERPWIEVLDFAYP